MLILYGCAFSSGENSNSADPSNESITEASTENEFLSDETTEVGKDSQSDADTSSEISSESELVSNSDSDDTVAENEDKASSVTSDSTDKSSIPTYTGEAFIELSGNLPDFTDEEKKSTTAFESYSELDDLGRCGVAFANVCPEIMPDEERGDIGDVRPSGWDTVKYPEVIEDNYLYNRSHLIAFSLAGENANEKNLITGTRYLNQETMQIFELKVLDYVRSTGNHVLYRVTPVFEGDNLVASGVQMEAWSVEDDGEGICYNVFCYNVQPGIDINYSTGESKLSETVAENNNQEATSGNDSDSSSEKNLETSSEIPLNQTTEQSDNNSADSTETGAGTRISDETSKENTEANSEGKAEVNSDNSSGTSYSKGEQETRDFIVNTNTHKFHVPTCRSVDDMAEKNKMEYTGTIEELKEMGYTPCGRCLAEYR